LKRGAVGLSIVPANIFSLPLSFSLFQCSFFPLYFSLFFISLFIFIFLFSSIISPLFLYFSFSFSLFPRWPVWPAAGTAAAAGPAPAGAAVPAGDGPVCAHAAGGRARRHPGQVEPAAGLLGHGQGLLQQQHAAR